MEHYSPLEKLDITDIDGVTDWHERFELYTETNSEITAANKTAHYLTLIGKQAYRLLKDLAFPKTISTMDVTDLQKLLQSHLTPDNYELAERQKFHNITKKPDESYRLFILRIQQQASKCNFGSNLETQLRDRLVAGITDQDLKKKILRESKVTFQSAKQILQSWDSVNTAISTTTEVFSANSNVKRKPNRNPHNRPTQPRSMHAPSAQHRPTLSSLPQQSAYPMHRYQTRSNTKSSGQCDSCGGFHRRNTCKFRNAICHSCKRVGHIQKVCRSKSKPVNLANTNDSDLDSNPAFTITDSPHHLLQKITFHNGRHRQFIVDTGSPVTFLPVKEYKSLGYSTADLLQTTSTIKGVSGHDLPVIGKFRDKVQTDKCTADLDFIVTQTGPMVLGLDGLRSLKVDVILQTSNPTPAAPISDLIAKCSRNQGGMKVTPVKFEMSGEPVFHKARSIPYGLRNAVQETLHKYVQDGILQPVNSSTWATPIVTPLKSNGQPRICGDFRLTVNQHLRQTATTTPQVEDMFEGLQGNQIFSRIDLSNAFLQIPLHDSAKEVTTINTPWGLYQYQYLPFGLSVSPGIFQQCIDQILHGLQGVKAYQDDIIVFGHTKAQHDQRLLDLLQTLDKFNVQINITKSEFAVSKLKYLGFIIDGHGISADAERIKALQSAPAPSTAEKLKSFLGFAQYYSKFVPRFSELAKPLYDLTNNFIWSNAANSAYKKLLDALIHGKVLKSFQLGSATELIVDASQHSIGAVLEQQGHPVTCISRKLSSSEQNYSQTQKEALAIHWSVSRLHKFLFGTHFKIITDHKALQYIFNPSAPISKTTSAMLQRWALQLSAYDYAILHRPGKDIAPADFLSRHAFSQEASTDEDVHLINPLPISRNILIRETKDFYGPVSAGLSRGWSNSARRRFPRLYAQRSDLTLSTDGILQFKDRILIPPSCRQDILKNLHLGHLGRDKMLSLSRMLCWWPSINADIKNFTRDCNRCKTKPRTHPNWTPWPIAYKPMQRIHADYCGPFLHNYWALVVQDSYSKFPEVFLTSNATADFTKKALQKFFAREGIPLAIVTDNGTHFSAQHLQTWLRSLGCCPVFTPPRHPQSNGQAENFVKTLKTAINATSPTTFEALDRSIDTFLLQYRNATHATTGKSPAVLFKGRNLRSFNNLDTTDIIFYRGNNNRPCEGLVIGQIGQRLFNVMDTSDGTLHRRHLDQVTFSPPQSPQQPSLENLPSTLPVTPKQDSIMESENLAPVSPSPLQQQSLPSTSQPQVTDPPSPQVRRSLRPRKPNSRYKDYV